MSAARGSSHLKLWIIAAIILVLYAVLVWFLGTWLVAPGTSPWPLRIGLWLLGFLALGITVWFLTAGRSAKQESAATDDPGALLTAAATRLSAARGVGERKLRNLPMVVVLGPSGATKTSVIVHSGLEPELLAGEVFQGDHVKPTALVNLWYTQRAVLLEAGGKLSGDHSRFARLIRRIRPPALKAMVTGRTQAPRAVLVCFGCDELASPGAEQAVLSSARKLRESLVELAQSFGVQLPVYVLFTKADRIPFFSEFTQHLTREESQQVFGTTLRWPARAAAGLYGDREFQRLTQSYERLLDSCAATRLELIPREPSGERQAGVYEFPRELRKLEALTVQFLVELCRPSQLELSPVLRGFYYTGVRAVVVGEAPAAGAGFRAAAGPADPGRFAATQAFDTAAASAAMPPVAGGGGGAGRKVPQWLFLGTLFREVLLRDPAPAAVARGARRIALLRRVGLVAAAVLFFFGTLWSTVQYTKNTRAVASARELSTVAASENGLVATEQLRRLEILRTHLQRLGTWGRWWFYKGTGVYPELRRVYADRFDAMLLDPARVALLHSLDSLPDSPNATVQYGRAYELLQSYLMTTSRSDKLSSDIVVPVLLERWLNGRPFEPEGRELARRQFDFYASRMCRGGCATEADERVVTRTRAFLVKFTGAERIYQLMVSDVSSRTPAIRFHQRAPAAAGLVVDNYDVPGAFTTPGWGLMQASLRHFDRFFQADDWVLGEQQQVHVDRAKLVQDLRAMYVADYIRRWAEFLDAASVVPFGSARDAAQKLGQLGGNQSPLLVLLSVVSQNTKVDSPTVGVAFQPVHLVMPPGSADRYVVDANQPYVAALQALQAAVGQAANAPPGGADALAAQTLDAARNAKTAVNQIALKFSVAGDAATVGGKVRMLLESPVDRVEHLMGRLPSTALNERGAAFCRALAPLVAKFPFTPDAGATADVSEVAAVFDPANGELWRFYNEALQNIMVKQGPRYVPKLGAAVTPTATFVGFFNRLAAVTDALWVPGSPDPHFDFSLKLLPSDAVPEATFAMDGHSVSFTRTFTAAQRFTWSGSASREVHLSRGVRGQEETLYAYEGPWSLFKLLQKAHWRSIGTTSLVQWVLLAQGQLVTVDAELNLGAARPILKGDYFLGLRCVSQIVP